MDISHATSLLTLLGDPSRVRMVALLARDELAVAELVEILGLAQSRVSSHLARLREAGVVRDRREGSSAFYSLAEGTMPEPARKVLELVRGEVRDATLEADARVAARIVARRRAPGWPESVAGHMEKHYSPGRTWESMARGMLGLLGLGDVLDVGCGDGTIAALLSPHARSMTCVDRSPKMIEAARHRLGPSARTELADGAALPFADASFDQVLLFHVLTCVEDPRALVREAARVLRPGGALAALALDRHDRLDLTSGYGHVVPGIAPAELAAMLRESALDVEACEVSSRERREPYFQVVSASARKRGAVRQGKANRLGRTAARRARREPEQKKRKCS